MNDMDENQMTSDEVDQSEYSDEINEQENLDNQEEDNNKSPNEPSYSDIELKAMEKGWKPKEKYKSDKPFRSAEDFLVINKMNHEIKRLQEKLDRMEKYSSDDRLEKLVKVRKEKMMEGDYDEVDKLDDKIYELKRDRERNLEPENVEKVQKTTSKDPNPAFLEFVKRNHDWFNDSNPGWRAYADAAYTQIQKSNPYLSMEEILMRVENETRRAMGSQNSSPQRSKMESGSRIRPSSKKENNFESMPEEFKKEALKFERQFGVSRDTYAKNYWEEAGE